MDQAIVPTEERTTLYIPSPGAASEAMKALQEAMKAVLDDSDYATIGGKKWRKRTAFTKLRRVFNISITVLEETWEDLGDDGFGCRVSVRAAFPGPYGRYEDGDGYCDSMELGHGIKATRHNVRAKAHTRAKNRATADLLGTGEVSAEELTPEEPKRPRKALPVRHASSAGDTGGNVANPHNNSNQAGGNVVNEPPSVFWHLYNTQGKAAGIPVEQARALVAGGDWRTAIGKLRELIGSGAAQRPYAPGQLADCLARKIDAKPASQRHAPATEKQVPFIAQKLEECFAGEDNAADKRHAVLGWLVGKKSAKALTKAEASAILDWLLNDAGTLHSAAAQEARAVHRQVLKEAGQAEMEM